METQTLQQKKVIIETTEATRRQLKSLAAISGVSMRNYMGFLAEFAERNRLVFPESVAERWPLGTRETPGVYRSEGGE